jgi:putative transposase
LTAMNHGRHHRRSIRLKGYDYAQAGAYFVTMCTRDRACRFGDVVDGQMQVNQYGQVVADSWLWLSGRYPYVGLDEWVVMPNHLHGIIILTEPDGRGGSRTAPTQNRKSLGRLIGTFKMVSTKRLNAIRHTPGDSVWQRNYYEHIVRNEESLARIRQYIIDNPARWDKDRENPLAVGALHEAPLPEPEALWLV